jgi:hypothetical protein
MVPDAIFPLDIMKRKALTGVVIPYCPPNVVETGRGSLAVSAPDINPLIRGKTPDAGPKSFRVPDQL